MPDDRDLRARVEYEPIDGADGLELASTWLGPIPLGQAPCTAEGKRRREEFAGRINALIDARISELLAANTREVERRRAAEEALRRLVIAVEQVEHGLDEDLYQAAMSDARAVLHHA